MARNRDSCEHDLWLSFSSFGNLGLRGLKIALRSNLESWPGFAKVLKGFMTLRNVPKIHHNSQTIAISIHQSWNSPSSTGTILSSGIVFKTPLDKHCNVSHCKIEIVLSYSDSYTLELSLLVLKATISSESCVYTFV